MSVLASYAIGLTVVVGLMIGWVAVQRSWLRTFPDEGSEPDALALRAGCHGCGCTDRCERHVSPESVEEDSR